MSQIDVFSELHLKRDKFATELRAAEAEVQAFARRMGLVAIKVPITVTDQVTRATQTLSQQATSKPISIPARIVDEITPMLERIRREQASRPITIPVVYAPAGGAGAAAVGAGGAAGQAATAAAAGGTTGGGNARFGRVITAGYFAYEQINRAFEAAQKDWESGHLNDRDPMEQLRRQRALIEDRYSGISGTARNLWARAGQFQGRVDQRLWGRNFQNDLPDRLNPQTYEDETRKLDEAEEQMRRTQAKEVLAKRGADFRKSLFEQTRDMDVAVTQGQGGEVAGKMAQISLSLKRHDEAAQHIEDAWQTLGYKTLNDAKAAANAIRTRSYQIFLSQQFQVNAAAQAEEDRTGQNIAEIQQGGAGAAMHAQGRGRQAAFAGRLNAVGNRLADMRIAWMNETDPVKKDQLKREYDAAQAAAPAQYAALGYDERQSRMKDYYSASGAIIDTQAAGRVADLRGANRMHAAAVEQVRDAVDRRIRTAQNEYDLEGDPTRKAQLGQVLAAERAAGAKEKAAAEAQEMRRIKESVTDFIIGKDKAALSEASKDYEAETKIFEKEWDKRIEKLETSDEKRAATEEMAAERHARQVKHDREIDDLHTQERESFLRAAGGDRLAQIYDLNADVKRQLEQAGGDNQRRRAILGVARGRLAEMAHDAARPQMFGSWREYLSSVQHNAIDGTGGVMDLMQTVNKQWGIAERTGDRGRSDAAFARGSDALNKAADKLLKSTVLVLRD